MKRMPTKTVRVDIESHEALRRLSVLYREKWSRHVSIADVIRMGVSLSYRELERISR